MRVLIDESLPVELATELPGHEVSTVRREGWIRYQNGALLRAAVRAGFEVLVTADSNLRHQQNLKKLGIAAIVVTRVRNRIEELRPLIPQIIGALQTIAAGDAVEIAP